LTIKSPNPYIYLIDDVNELLSLRGSALKSFLLIIIIISVIGVGRSGYVYVYSQQDEKARNNNNNNEIPFIGVSMRGYYTSLEQTKTTKNNYPPPNYYDDSFRMISQAGMNHVRILFYWEAYQKNPVLFTKELETIANSADKWGLKVLYDNHQWHTSSWLEPKAGTGFPSFLYDNNPRYQQGGGGNTADEAAKIWWTDWWNRSVKDQNGRDGWSLLAEFLKKVIVGTVDGHKSTLGYEILSEPQIHNNDQWEKVGKFNTFMTNELRKVTQKIIAYSQQVPASINAKTISVTAENQAKMVPLNKSNVIFKISLYGVPTDPYHGARLSMLLNAGKLAGVPIYVGEWNNVEREKTGGIFKINPAKSDISQSDVNLFVQTFKKLKLWGWAYWQWNFKLNKEPNFNLVTVSEDDLLQPTKYYEQLKNAISSIYSMP
jgi:hypothetical protein